MGKKIFVILAIAFCLLGFFWYKHQDKTAIRKDAVEETGKKQKDPYVADSDGQSLYERKIERERQTFLKSDTRPVYYYQDQDYYYYPPYHNE